MRKLLSWIAAVVALVAGLGLGTGTANASTASHHPAQSVSARGEMQPMEPLWNGAGYLRNVVETVRVMAT